MRYLFLSVLAASFSVSVAQAQAVAPSAAGAISAETPASALPKSQAHYELELLYSTYTQNEPGAFKSSGNLAGFSLGGEYDLRHSKQMVLWGIDYFTGTPTSDSVSQSGQTQSQTADTDFYTFGVSWATRQHLGESTFALQESLGTDYRYLEFKARGGKSAQQEQIFLYVPVGLGLTWQMADRWQLRAAAEEDFVVSGSSRDHLENINPKMPTLHLTENSGSGTKLSLGTRHKGQELDVTGELYYRNWQIADSSTQDYTDLKGKQRVGFTPANTTEMVGLGVGVTY